MNREEFMKELRQAKTVLDRCHKGEQVSEPEIRVAQQFFNKVGTHFLREAFKEAHALLHR